MAEEPRRGGPMGRNFGTTGALACGQLNHRGT
jgi:hypothetical protein